ncbi:MAG TPA: hypothetical protein VLE91_04345 [Candidatus Saccharimonadales bacterium]|nr:hypothetical protein [Candidatus Saccharimonadales bacterium]
MPDRETIITNARALQPSSFEEHLNPDQIWPGNQYGAKFELTRAQTDTLDQFQLTITGSTQGKPKLRRDFVTALGEPQAEFTLRRLRNAVYMAWDASSLPPEEKTEEVLPTSFGVDGSLAFQKFMEDPESISPKERLLVGLGLAKASFNLPDGDPAASKAPVILNTGLELTAQAMGQIAADKSISEREKLLILNFINRQLDVSQLPLSKDNENLRGAAKVTIQHFFLLAASIKSAIDERKEELMENVWDGFSLAAAAVCLSRAPEPLTTPLEQVKYLAEVGGGTLDANQRRNVAFIFAKDFAKKTDRSNDSQFSLILDYFAKTRSDHDAALQLGAERVKAMLKMDNPFA